MDVLRHQVSGSAAGNERCRALPISILLFLRTRSTRAALGTLSSTSFSSLPLPLQISRAVLVGIARPVAVAPFAARIWLTFALFVVGHGFIS